MEHKADVSSVPQTLDVRSQQCAMLEILAAISMLQDDAAPVFDLILEHVAKSSDAPIANLSILDQTGAHIDLVAHRGVPGSHFVVGKTTTSIDGDDVSARAVRESRPIQIDNLKESDLYRRSDPQYVYLVDVERMRSILAVPILDGSKAIGSITLFRRVEQKFTETDSDRVGIFTSQAMIAVNTVRQFNELQLRLKREAATSKVLQIISKSRNDDGPVFDTILESAARLCDAHSAALLLVNPERTRNEVHRRFGPVLNLDKHTSVESWSLDSGQAHAAAVRTGRSVHVPDLKQTELYKAGDPTRIALVDELGILTALAVPVLLADEAIGALVLHRTGTARPFSDDDIKLVETFASQAVIAIENARQFAALEDLNAELGDRVKEQVGEIERMGRLKRFLPAAVADTIISQGSEKLLTSHRALIGVLFCDIRGFTAFCESAEPEETIEVLQTYHEEMGKLISEHGAGVDHRMGDGIMVLFNDPLPCDDPTGDAIKLAVAMRERMVELCKAWKKLGHRLGFGVGVSLGYATVGMVGYEGRSDYTASGTSVNLAARLCDRAENREILLSARAYAAIEDDFPCEHAGEMSLKGIREPVEVFRLLENYN